MKSRSSDDIKEAFKGYFRQGYTPEESKSMIRHSLHVGTLRPQDYNQEKARLQPLIKESYERHEALARQGYRDVHDKLARKPPNHKD